MRTWWLAALFFFLGCSPPEAAPKLPGQGDAEAIIWRDVFGRSDEPPDVEWLTGARLNCPDPAAPRGWLFKSNWDLDTGERLPEPRTYCVAGLELTAWHVMVAMPEGAAFHQTALSHEFGHALLERDGRDPDPLHVGPMFAPGGPVARADMRLQLNGY